MATSGINLFKDRSLNCSTHICEILIWRAKRSFRCLFSGSVLIRLLISWIVFYHSLILLSPLCFLELILRTAWLLSSTMLFITSDSLSHMSWWGYVRICTLSKSDHDHPEALYALPDSNQADNQTNHSIHSLSILLLLHQLPISLQPLARVE